MEASVCEVDVWVEGCGRVDVGVWSEEGEQFFAEVDF